ncbi:MAG: two-component regulator propeller domain-containing protein [Kofleriaceae bacterium]
MSFAAAIANAAIAVYTNTSEVRACLPLDDGGFLVGTGGGLVWTDAKGAQKRVWTKLDGLPATRIDGIEMVNGEMWIGTEHGALRAKLEKGQLVLGRGAGGFSIRDVVRFDNKTYLATNDGVRVEQHMTSAPVPFKGGSNRQGRARVSSLAIADGALWAGTEGGLYRMRNGTFELTAIASGANYVTALYGDGKTLWIGTSNGLYTREGAKVRDYGGGNLRAVTKIDGAIVAVGLGGGFVTVDRGRLVTYNGAPKVSMVQALTESDGAVCTGGLDGLAVRSSAKTWTQVAAPQGIPANDISALAADGDALWVGTFDKGLAKFEKGVWTKIESQTLDYRINAILVEPRGKARSRIWVATANGISIVDQSARPPAVTEITRTEGLPARGVLSLARLRDGRVLAGTMHGAAILADGARPVAIGLKQNLEVKNVWAVAEDSQGYLWIGATTGVYRGKPDDTGWTRYSVATKHLRDDWVMALAVRDNEVYVGTYKGGLTRFDLGTAPTATQLGEGWINPGGLRWDSGTLYASTMNGLASTDGRGDWSSSTTYTVDDTTATERVGELLFIATRRGVVSKR